jgi:polysaccharide export outer membrane protein
MSRIIKIILTPFFLTLFLFNGMGFCADVSEEVKDYYRLGNVYYQQGRYKEAEEQYQKALDLIRRQEQDVPGLSRKVIIEEPREETEPVKTISVQPPETSNQVEYRIGDEDVLTISVWQNPDLDQEAVVRPDGMVSFPLVGDLQAAGLTVSQFDQQLTKKLSEYVKYPEVSISIKKIGGKKVMVLGQVRSPGVYSVTGAKTILEAISLAGGFSDHAVSSSVVLIRGGFGNPQAQRINLTKALNGSWRQNVSLQSEDVVFVPKKFIANLNYFLGQILDPLSKGLYTADQLHNW